MITFFNKVGNSWVAKIICAALAISMMAFWGLGGLSSSFSGNDHKAIIVASDVITIDKLNQQLNQERNKISALTGQDISTKKMVELGILDNIINQLINEKIMENMADKIGLEASDESVRKYIERNPLFKNNLGNFDSNLFYAYMGQLKINQVQLSEKLKQELKQQHLSHALSRTTLLNSPIIDLVANSQKEKREILALFLAQKNINVGSPSEEVLKEYYDAYQEEFMNPEYRQINLLKISSKNFIGEKAYEKMYQVVQDLEDLLGEGISLVDAAKKLELQTPDSLKIDISGKDATTQSVDNRLKDNPILQEIFALSEGESTSITDYKDGFLVAEVKKVIPVSEKPFNSVRDQVLSLWKTEQQKDKLPQLVKKVTEQIRDSNNWSTYTPIKETIEQTKASKIPLEILSNIFSQKKGYKNVQSYQETDGTWIIVVNNVIHNKQALSEKERDSARKIYTSDLFTGIQQAYAKDLNIKINETAIKKFFATYLNDED